jgi:uncharacterized protein (TIGR02284 family)
MSIDEKVTKDLIQTLEDGTNGFQSAAEKLSDSDRADLASRFNAFSAERSQFADELRSIAGAYGDQINESGSVAAAAHRGWMAVKDALTGSSPSGVLDVAEQGEDHAVSEYRKALDEDISPELRAVVQRQFTSVQATHDEVKSLQLQLS